MSLRILVCLPVILLLAVACLPTYDPGAGATEAMTTGTSSSGDLPPEDTLATTFGPEPTSSTTDTTGTTSTTADTSTTGGPLCGDGHVDPGEDCDLGPDNANDGACTMMCNPAVCGDGLLWVGHEECDFGAGNVGGHGGCNQDCTWAPRCGDGKVDAGFEECDLGALNGTGMGLEDAVPCGATCRWQGRLVFVTSETWHDERHFTSALSTGCHEQWRLYCFEDGYTED